MSSKKCISLDSDTDVRLAFIASLMCVSKADCISFLVNSMFARLMKIEI